MRFFDSQLLILWLTDLFCVSCAGSKCAGEPDRQQRRSGRSGGGGEDLREHVGMGYNAMTDTYKNLLEAGVIDPAKVTRCALQDAVSLAGTVMTTHAIVSEKPGKKSAMQMQSHGRSGKLQVSNVMQAAEKITLVWDSPP
ncbi:hypothetical protein M758_UG107200 [Ceratodon purpureus]|nr:hypothetical protein M758_UG107200 [Ceratodon purpureus]